MTRAAMATCTQQLQHVTASLGGVLCLHPLSTSAAWTRQGIPARRNPVNDRYYKQPNACAAPPACVWL